MLSRSHRRTGVEVSVKKIARGTHGLRFAYLLHEHDYFRGNHSSPVAGNFDELDEGVALVFFNLSLSFKKNVHVVCIPRRLNLGIPQPHHRLIGLIVTILAHVPSRRFRAQEHKCNDD